MRLRYLYIISFVFLCTYSSYAQLDSIQQLPEVLLSDTKLLHFSKGFKLEKLSDTTVAKNATSLTETLRYNASIYFKENGFGMVSSPSFRGTNAAQTAVVWNGININSVFTGQTDFNTISPLSYNEIAIRSGGGGVQYGSGAVGGSIHLNNTYTFNKTNLTEIDLSYGSFETIKANAKTTYANANKYISVGVNFVNSENDYEYVGKDKKNIHGQYTRFAASINEARKLKYGVATWNSEYTYNNRNFSGSLNTIGKDAYKDVATRNLLQLQQTAGVFNIKTSFAHLYERYRYYPDSNKALYDEGLANTLIGNLNTEVFLLDKLRLNAKVEYTYLNGKGDNVGENTRKTLATVVLLNHQLSEDFSYGLNFRKEFLNDFDNPLLFSADAKWNVSNAYALRLNGSKNYRIPTFNDLYWNAGGNLALKPETSYQVELGQELSVKNIKLDLAAYYIASEELIKWVPVNGTLWQPVNIQETTNYGLEADVSYDLKFRNDKSLRFSANYAYTKAEDLKNDKQLIYVPFHKTTANLQYHTAKLTVYLQGLHTGEVFTTTDNSETLEGYTVFNLGAEYRAPFAKSVTIGGRLKNVFNSYYENVAYRPMPSRNFEIFLNFNI